MADAAERHSDARWWKATRSLRDIADYLERSLNDKQNLEQKLAELLVENKRLSSNGRQQAELAARERLLRDEFERKTQELRLEMNKERRLLSDSVDRLKKELAGCFCRQAPGDHFEIHSQPRFENKALRSRSPRRPA
jgi:hypothetical protein